MTDPGIDLSAWENFVLEHGFRAQAYELAAVLSQPVDEIERVRRTGACRQAKSGKRFPELFALWHGRAPEDVDWPAPRKRKNGSYEWQARDFALLASLVGQVGIKEISEILTSRLRTLTGDAGAVRSRNAVQLNMNRIGMQTCDVLGGITTADAAREIGSRALINQAVAKKHLVVRRVGRLWVIPHGAWAKWKAKRVFPPADGYVRLSTIREALAIRSDKLSEFARMGYIPTAVRCNPYGARGPSTQFGTWYITQEVAEQLVADRRAGRPMPWHGKPIAENLRATFKLWQERKHPQSCETCRQIWGEAGAPQTFDDYIVRYKPLAHGAKRHLTRPWSPGLSVREVAVQAQRTEHYVRRAIANGMLAATKENDRTYVSRTDATRWITRKCPTGDSEKSWLSVETACEQYQFTRKEIAGFIAGGRLNSRIPDNGPGRGMIYVSRHQCGQLREKIGFTEEQAARRVDVTVDELRTLLEGVDWRQAGLIPLVTVQAVVKRLKSQQGYTLEEAATQLETTVEWVLAKRDDGTIKVSRTNWDRNRIYITMPMFERLRAALLDPQPARERLSADWLMLSDAAEEAGVTTATLIKWANAGEVERKHLAGRWMYRRDSVRARARRYWPTARFHRATPPAWLQGASA